MQEKKKFLDKFPMESHRLSGYDYGSQGAYFITIKTHQMKEYFGEVVQTSHRTSPQPGEEKYDENEIECLNKEFQPVEETCPGTFERLSQIGLVAKENWEAISSHFPFVELEVFQVMPNHIHGIIVLNKSKKWFEKYG